MNMQMIIMNIIKEVIKAMNMPILIFNIQIINIIHTMNIQVFLFNI